MYLYKENVIHKFESIAEILEYFYQVRLGMYEKRKTLLLYLLKEQMEVLLEKIKFITLVIEDPNVIFRQTKHVIQQNLEAKGFTRIDSLLSMSMYSWTLEKITELQKELDKVQSNYHNLEAKSPAQLWTKDLELLRTKLLY
jgi:DNA topoisomerase-2